MWKWNKRDDGGSSIAEEVASTHAISADQLWHLIYASAAQPGVRDDELDLILRSARRRNAKLDVTGMLMLVDGTFTQILEGSFENVHCLFDRIKVDGRHSHVQLLQSEPISHRSFPDWSMSPPCRTLREFADARDPQDFFKGVRPLFNLEDEKLQRVVELFHSGAFAQTERWASAMAVNH